MQALLTSPRSQASRALALCFLVALAPILAAHMPPIMDFPNHLARIWLMAGGADEAPLSSIYQIDLAKAGANVGMDLIAAAMARALPIFVVGKILVALAFLGPTLGALALSRALSGRLHPAQIALLALVWSTTAIAGFVYFQISLGLALAFAAVGAKGGNFARDVAFAALLLFVHPLGMAFYVATVVALRFGPDLSAAALRRGLVALPQVVAAAAIPVVAAGLVFKSQARPAWPFWGDWRSIYDPLHALTILASPILSYNLKADLFTAAPVVALIGFALAARYVRAHAGLTLAALALFCLAPAAPDAIGDGSWLPQRLPIMAGWLFLAGLGPRAQAPRWASLAFALPVLARALWIGWVWSARQSDVAGLEDALRGVTPGAAVVSLQQEPADWRQAPVGRFMIGSPNGVRAVGRHLGALAVIERRAFVPTLFAVPGQHALDVAPGWRDIAVEASAIPYPRQLGQDVAGDPYLKLWRTRFDFVLLLDADLPAASHFDDHLRVDLETLADRGFARLYGVAEPVSERDDDDPLTPRYR